MMCNDSSSGDLDINLLIAETARILRLAAGDKLILRTQLDPTLSRVKADSKLIGWVLLSLAALAYDAAPAGSEIGIVTANVVLHRAAADEVYALPGAYAQIELTARASRLDAGAIIRAIVEQAQGTITSRSIGSDVVAVRVLLPTTTRPAPSVDGVARAVDRARVARVILVVDDEPAARELIRTTLEGAGYDVLEACNGREAEAVLAGSHVDLMITDIVMPEQDGLETIKAVRKTHPLLRIIAMSDAASGYQLRAAKLLGADAVIAKPLTHGVLGDTVRSQLGGRG
jgi:CheY-like chemotaxis protein